MPKTTITVALICHDNVSMYHRKLEEIKAWTRQPDELLIYASEGSNLKSFDPQIVRYVPDTDDKGYAKRHRAYMEASRDWVYCVNYDDIHDFHVLEKLEAALHFDTTVVHHLATGKYGSGGAHFVPFNSGAENFMVRRSVAQQVGGYAPFIGEYNAGNTGDPPDQKFIKAVCSIVPRDSIELVPETLIVML